MSSGTPLASTSWHSMPFDDQMWIQETWEVHPETFPEKFDRMSPHPSQLRCTLWDGSSFASQELLEVSTTTTTTSKITKGNEKQPRGYNNENKTPHPNLQQQQNRWKEVAGTYVAKPTKGRFYVRNQPLCDQCKLHHTDRCPDMCRNYQKLGHPARHYKDKTIVTCYGCGKKRAQQRPLYLM